MISRWYNSGSVKALCSFLSGSVKALCSRLPMNTRNDFILDKLSCFSWFRMWCRFIQFYRILKNLPQTTTPHSLFVVYRIVAFICKFICIYLLGSESFWTYWDCLLRKQEQSWAASLCIFSLSFLWVCPIIFYEAWLKHKTSYPA